jgi:hypothetical protein
MAEFEAIEARRQAGLREAKTRRDAQQRVLMISVSLLVVGFLVVVVAALAWANFTP